MHACLVSIIALSALAAADKPLLWNPDVPLPTSAEVEQAGAVEFHAIKPFEPERDGYRWLHGVALAWHGDRLYASYGVNEGSENTATEKVQIRVSADGGRSWTHMAEIASGDDRWAVSHGIFASHGDRLYAFLGGFEGFRQNVHMRGNALSDADQVWEPMGVVGRDDFWPMGEPQRTSNGNWIIPGIAVTARSGQPGNPAAVAICRDSSFAAWDVIAVPRPDDRIMWGESTLLVDGGKLTCIARCDGSDPVALVSTSRDNGETWSPVVASNLPMAASKPYAGVLSTGQRYLICTTTADAGNRRAPLTIAVSKPGEELFSKVYCVRDALQDGPGESHPGAALSYPYAVEHERRLYVGYSNDGGRGGNANSAELAIIPIESLQAP